MPVFKAYFLVIRKILPSLIVYFSIFVVMATIFVKVVGGGTMPTDFRAVRNDIVIQSADDTALVAGLTEYLGQNANIVTLGNKGDSLEDALFFGRVDDVLIIPAGFTESFMSGGNTLQLERTSNALTGSAVNTDLLIGRYLDLARLYVLNVPAISQEELVGNVARDLGEAAPVSIASSTTQLKTGDVTDTFRYMAYTIIALLIMGITSIMMAFNKAEVARRNQCAPISPAKMNVQLFAGNLIFTLAVWFLLGILAYILSGQKGIGPNLLLLYLNTLVFSITALSIAFLAGKFIKGYGAQSAVANVLSLGLSFISGIFVPQFLLGETVLKIASFTPTYWYIKAVEAIKDLSVYSFTNLKPVFADMLIQLAFAAACFIIALVASKQKRQNANG
jgi:ABC-2 type transport system permease protein